MTVSIYRAHKPTVLAMLAVLGSLTIAVLALGAASARAGIGYKAACTPPGAPKLCEAIFNVPAGVAVDNSASANAGDVYVSDISNNRVVRFNAAGVEQSVITPPLGGDYYVAVDPTNGDVYVSGATNGHLYKFDTSGAPIGSFLVKNLSEPTGIAVDPTTGNVYVAEKGSNEITEFTSSGTLVGSFPSGTAEVDSIAIDTEGNLYLTSERHKIVKLAAANRAEVTTIDENADIGVAVDLSNNDIYVGRNTGAGQEIAVFNSSDTLLTSFGAGAIGSFGAVGLAVNKTTHAVYASELENNVGIFFEEGATPEAPETATPAAEITGTTAKLKGKLNPKGAAGELEYQFDYSTGATCNSSGFGTTPAAPVVVAEAKEKAVEAEATGLSPLTKYKFCLVAKNGFGSTLGNEVEFETIAGPPAIEAEKVVAITPTTITLEATINPEGAETTCEVEYGTVEKTLSSSVPCPGPLTAPLTESKTVTVELTGLTAATLYYWRFAATNTSVGNPTTLGTEEQATTKPLVEVETRTQSEVTGEGATLNGGIKTGSEGGSYQFEYLEGAVGVGNLEAGTKTKLEVIAGETNGFQAVSAAISGLTPSTTYHYRIVGYPAGSVTPINAKEELEFTTSAAKPKVTSESAGNEERHSVALSGELNPEGAETKYFFEYATEEAYDEAVAQKKSNPYSEVPVGEGGTTSEATTAAAVTPVKVGPVTAIELHAGTVYHYRLVAVNSTGTSYGPDHTFETEEPQFPFVESEPQPPFGEEVTQEVTSPTTASIKAKVNADGLPTSYVLEIGTEVVSGKPVYSTPTFGEVGSNLEPVTLTFQLTNLLPGTTYHYRVVVFNEDGTFVGADHAFATGTFPSVIAAPASVQLVPTPVEVKPPPPPKPETNAQKLTKALKLCKKQPKKKQAACDRKAKNKYGPKKPKKKAKKK
jgi:hypothetical protein